MAPCVRPDHPLNCPNVYSGRDPNIEGHSHRANPPGPAMNNERQATRRIGLGQGRTRKYTRTPIRGTKTNLDGSENSDWLMAERLGQLGQLVCDWTTGRCCPAVEGRSKKQKESGGRERKLVTLCVFVPVGIITIIEDWSLCALKNIHNEICHTFLHPKKHQVTNKITDLKLPNGKLKHLFFSFLIS